MPPKMVSLAAAPASGLAEIMRQIYRSGSVLIPLGGQNGKKPLIAGWNGRRLPLDTCLRRMAGMNSTTYGIRLDGLLVVDCDTDNDVTRALFAERFPPTPFVVQTGRGTHHYYRHDGLVPAAIRGRDIAIDFKAGSSAFVVGPGSIRPDGKTYRILGGHIGVELPRFEDRERSPLHLVGKRRIEVGQRNLILWQRAIQYAPLADDYDGLLADLAALRNIEFEDPASVPNSEIVKVA